jgi:5-methylcytosine-specific restriction enzyme A
MALKRNPPWARDELILALDLYFRCNPLHTSEKNPEIVELSQVLNALPIHTSRPDADRFRNPNGVYMKLCNFLRLDPGYNGVGLDAGAKMDEVVWKEFDPDRARLGAVARAIRAHAGTDDGGTEIIDEERGAPEGQILFRQHRLRERKASLVRKKKALAKRHGVYSCEACGFDRSGSMAPLGDATIEMPSHNTTGATGSGQTDQAV